MSPTGDLPFDLFRWFVLFLGALLLGVLAKWVSIHPKRCRVGAGLGVALLVVEALIDRFSHRGQPVGWHVWLDAAAFTILIVSLRKMRSEHLKHWRDEHGLRTTPRRRCTDLEDG